MRPAAANTAALCCALALALASGAAAAQAGGERSERAPRDPGVAAAKADVERRERAPREARASVAASHVATAPIAEEAEPDTLDQFLEQLADSTEAYFGISAASRDTAGLDSALAYGLAHPEELRRRRLPLGARPSFSFNRVDGPVWGGVVSIGAVREKGQLIGQAGFAAGPNDWLGGGEYRKSWAMESGWWTFRAGGERETRGMDRDHPEHHLATIRALLAGKDRKRYFRREGFLTTLERESETARGSIGYRDMLESGLGVTTLWNLLGQEPSVLDNLPAARGRARELEVEVGVRMPFAPVIAEVSHINAGPWSGSDFDYQRTRVAAAANIGLGALASLVPQVAYGRLTGDPIPQATFYLGGSHSLYSLPSAGRGGTGMALARLDLIGATDILALARIPHPAMFPIQAGLFVAGGAVWGVDPYGGPARSGTRWPGSGDWVQEAGLALMYQPGIPSSLSFIRVNYTLPLGPHRESEHWTIVFTKAIDLVTPLGD